MKKSKPNARNLLLTYLGYAFILLLFVGFVIATGTNRVNEISTNGTTENLIINASGSQVIIEPLLNATGNVTAPYVLANILWENLPGGLVNTTYGASTYTQGITTAADSGLAGGAASGAATLTLKVCSNGQVLKNQSGGWACAADTGDPNVDAFPLNQLVNNYWVQNTSATAGINVTGIYSSGTIAAGVSATPVTINYTGIYPTASLFWLNGNPTGYNLTLVSVDPSRNISQSYLVRVENTSTLNYLHFYSNYVGNVNPIFTVSDGGALSSPATSVQFRGKDALTGSVPISGDIATFAYYSINSANQLYAGSFAVRVNNGTLASATTQNASIIFWPGGDTDDYFYFSTYGNVARLDFTDNNTYTIGRAGNLLATLYAKSTVTSDLWMMGGDDVAIREVEKPDGLYSQYIPKSLLKDCKDKVENKLVTESEVDENGQTRTVTKRKDVITERYDECLIRVAEENWVTTKKLKRGYDGDVMDGDGNSMKALKQENADLKADNDKLLAMLKTKGVVTQAEIDAMGFKKLGKG